MITLPTADIWPDMEQCSEVWFNARKGRLTASNAKAILTGKGKLSSSAQNHIIKLVRESCKIEDPFAFIGNKATDWGNEQEGNARQAFADQESVEVVEIAFATHREMTCVGCSPDGIIVEDGKAIAGLEIKCPSPDKLLEWHVYGAGLVPDDHLAQVHLSMIVTGLKRWEFVGYFPGINLFRASAEWDDYTDKMLDAIQEFVINYAEMRGKILPILGITPKQETIV